MGAAAPATPSAPPTKVGMINLGCAKNLVDAEIMLGSVRARGMDVTASAEDADVLIVNTCAFIDSAKEESIEAILRAHQERGLRRRPGQKLVVSGCLAQRFSAELVKELPEVDAFMGLDQVAETGAIISRLLAADSALPPSVGAPSGVGSGSGSAPASTFAAAAAPGLVNDRWEPLNLVTRKPTYVPDYDTPRFRLTPAHSVYVKIAEGCNHPCSFCVIPQMRGRHRSRTIDSVVAEVRALVQEQGAREINLISQDTTYFGMDRWTEKAGPRQPVDSARGPTLGRLLEALQAVEGDFWVRLLYTHPAHWSDELIATIARCDKVARYVDMPLQHIHPEMLRLMRRETSREHIEDLIDRLRAGIPGLTLRTTFIVGFPGETEEHFDALREFVDRRRFERLGVFTYSREEGSRAAGLPGQVPAAVRRARYRRAMETQQRVAADLARQAVGRRLRVLADAPLVARAQADAPEVDGRVLLDRPVRTGRFVEVEVTDTQIYDLRARVVREE